jgi:hypothetical protein
MWKQSTMLKAGMLPRGTRSTLMLPRGAFPTTTTNTSDESGTPREREERHERREETPPLVVDLAFGVLSETNPAFVALLAFGSIELDTVLT